MIIILILLLIALGFVIWPAFSGRNEKISQEAENLRLYNQRKNEIMSSDHSADEREQMLLELDYELISNDADAQGLKDASPKQKILTAFVVFVGIAVSVLYLYDVRGAQDELLATQLLNKMSIETLTAEEHEALRESLQSAAEKKPKHQEWQYLHARMLFADRRYVESIKAFEKVYAFLPEEATADRAAALFQIAQAKYYSSDQQASEEIYVYLKRALALEPNNSQVLGLAGVTAFELTHLEDALAHWKALWFNVAGSSANRSDLAPLKEGILRLASLLEEQGKEVDVSWMEAAEITVVVSISNALKAQLQDDDVVFVIAKEIDGSPMPLAAVKIMAKNLPKEVILDDGLGMMSGSSLSQFERVEVIARVAKSGQPMASSGDFQGRAASVIVKTDEKVSIVIDHIVE
jgi:cytochrome c-type biogenesis protein CcmH